MEWRLIFMALICLCIAQVAFADNTQRMMRFSKEIRCVSCQNQTLFDSNAPIATTMRDQIYNMFNDGMSEQQIRDHLSYKYGDYILFNPPWKLGTLLLWLGPFIMLGIAMLSLWRIFNV